MPSGERRDDCLSMEFLFGGSFFEKKGNQSKKKNLARFRINIREPDLMDYPPILSPFSNNKVSSLPPPHQK